MCVSAVELISFRLRDRQFLILLLLGNLCLVVLYSLRSSTSKLHSLDLVSRTFECRYDVWNKPISMLHIIWRGGRLISYSAKTAYDERHLQRGPIVRFETGPHLPYGMTSTPWAQHRQRMVLEHDE